MVRNTHLVVYLDGSTRPTNPGYSGYGIFGYTLKPSKKPNKTKHPSKTKYKFTSTGFNETADTVPYETVNILEHIGSINNRAGTNNLGEMLAFIKVLEFTLTQDEIKSVYAVSDSEYVVVNYKENLAKWKTNGWKRTDGKPIVHYEEWATIELLSNKIKELGIALDITWIKGHSDDYGNETADLYAAIGANYARQQLEGNVSIFNEVAFHNYSTYAEYKKTLDNKDIVFYFRDLFFSSDPNTVDSNFCFLTTNEDPNDIGKRNIASIFLTNIGYVPEPIVTIKRVFRDIPREYISNCCIRLSRINDREMLRLMYMVGVDKLLHKVNSNSSIQLYLIKDTSPFVMEYTYDYPYAVEASKVFNRTVHVQNSLNENDSTDLNDGVFIVTKDITDLVVKANKIAFSNNTSQLDLSSYFENQYNFIHTLHAKVGYDLPNYLSLKSIENVIKKVTATVELSNDSNYVTLYITIYLEDRVLCSTNILNKYLVRR